MTELLTPKRTIAEASIDTKLIYALLSKAKPGDIVTYSAINQAIGRDIQKKRGALMTAENMARKLDNMVFSCIANVGLKRLNDSEIISETSAKTHQRVNALTHKAVKNYACVNPDNISNDELTKLNVNYSIACTLKTMSQQRSIQRIESTPAPTQIPFNKVLELFKN